MCQTWVNHSREICQTELRSRARFNSMLLENFSNMFLECSQKPSRFQESRATSSAISYYLCVSLGMFGKTQQDSSTFSYLSVKSINWSPTWNSEAEPPVSDTRYSLQAYCCRLPEAGSSWPQPSSPHSYWCQLWSLPFPYNTICSALVPPGPGQTPTHRYTFHDLALLCCRSQDRATWKSPCCLVSIWQPPIYP